MSDDFTGLSLYARIQDDAADIAPQLVYSDWLEEDGRDVEARLWRREPVTSAPVYDFYGDGYGHGDGYGYGHGDGHGHGHGYGHGDGYGYGYGYGGDGDGDGYGYGGGYGDGNGYGEIKKRAAWLDANSTILGGVPVIGEQMLLWVGRGFAWVGRVEEMYAPGCYLLSNAGMLCRTGGPAWTDVASGKNRGTYIYRHAPDGKVFTGPELHGAILWKGDLPGKDVR